MTPVVVVGGGIVGASVAYHLARAGASVTVLFRDAGATASSFAWIGASPAGDWPGGAPALLPHVLDDWRRLARDVPGVSVRWTGSSRCPDDGAVDPIAAVRALLTAADGLGARIVPGVTVSADDISSMTRATPATTVVLAAGTGIGALTSRITVPSSPATLLRLRAPAGLVRSIVSTPHYDIREQEPGRLVATGPGEVSAIFAHLREAYGSGLQLIGSSVGHRPMPAGGPIIGPLEPSVHVAAMHSGICLGPTAGRLLSQEILTGRPAPELAGCRP